MFLDVVVFDWIGWRGVVGLGTGGLVEPFLIMSNPLSHQRTTQFVKYSTANLISSLPQPPASHTLVVMLMSLHYSVCGGSSLALQAILNVA